MTYQRLPYDDASSTTDMVSDCAEVGRALHLSVRDPDADDATRTTGPTDALLVPEGLAEMAAGMQLHFD